MVQSNFVDGLLQPVPVYVKENTKLRAAGAGDAAPEAFKSTEESELMRAVRPRINVSAELAPLPACLQRSRKLLNRPKASLLTRAWPTRLPMV